jgi:hypothetical protein
MNSIYIVYSANTCALAQTLTLLRSVLIHDLADIVYSYFASNSVCAYDLAKNGEWEAATMAKTSWVFGLWAACYEGYIDLVHLAISKGTTDWSSGLNHACAGGHLEIVKFMIEKGANCWNTGLWNACRYGHMEIARLMIDKGANDWNFGLAGACGATRDDTCKLELMRLMIDNGATQCTYCDRLIADHKC